MTICRVRARDGIYFLSQSHDLASVHSVNCSRPRWLPLPYCSNISFSPIPSYWVLHVNLCLRARIRKSPCIGNYPYGCRHSDLYRVSSSWPHALYMLSVADWISPHISLLFVITMLLRRYSTKPTPNRSPSPLASGSVRGRRSLNLVTHHQPFCASTAQIVEAESFASETSPRDILPIPSRPVSPLRLPPGNIGSGRQRTRHDTHETLCPTPIEEHVLPQPPNVIAASPVSQTSEPRASPTRSRRPAPGGIGRSASTPKSATRSDSSLPPYETDGPFEGMHAGFWPIYNKVSQEFDEKRLGKWDRDLDVLLIFVSFVVIGDR